MRRAVFFPSLPKCGKNLVYSFYFALGLQRWAWGESPTILHSHAFARFSDVRNYAFPESGDVGGLAFAEARDDIVKQLKSLPPNAVAHGHFLPEPFFIQHIAHNNTPTVFIRRDPRDVLVSMLNFARTRHLPTHVDALLRDLDDERALLFLLDGGGSLVPFADYFDAYYGWLSAPGVTILRFEDLIGPDGGGSEARQARACHTLAELAGFDADHADVIAARERVFNRRAGTFFRGQVGAWRESFTMPVQRRFGDLAGWLLQRWGYGDGAEP